MCLCSWTCNNRLPCLLQTCFVEHKHSSLQILLLANITTCQSYFLKILLLSKLTTFQCYYSYLLLLVNLATYLLMIQTLVHAKLTICTMFIEHLISGSLCLSQPFLKLTLLHAKITPCNITLCKEFFLQRLLLANYMTYFMKKESQHFVQWSSCNVFFSYGTRRLVSVDILTSHEYFNVLLCMKLMVSLYSSVFKFVQLVFCANLDSVKLRTLIFCLSENISLPQFLLMQNIFQWQYWLFSFFLTCLNYSPLFKIILIWEHKMNECRDNWLSNHGERVCVEMVFSVVQ